MTTTTETPAVIVSTGSRAPRPNLEDTPMELYDEATRNCALAYLPPSCEEDPP